MMKIEKLEIKNFRGIHHLVLDFHEQTNILVGVNGSGKSAILDCLAIMLSRLIGRIRSTKGTGRFFTERDITNGELETQNIINMSFRDRPLQWSVVKTRRLHKKQSITNLSQLKDIVKEIHYEMEKESGLDEMPLAVYYPVNRAVLDIPLRIRQKHEFDRLAAYDQALTGERSDFRIFFEWYRKREDLENELRLEKKRFRDPQLKAVRKAIESFLPQFSNLRVRRSPLRMTLLKDGQEIIINQLSDGEKCLLALVGDLARRLSIANPSFGNPLEGDAIILIDEIDLHLHPSWQRMVLQKLKETFPFCQFILTTHSPQILSHIKNAESVFLLEIADEKIHASHPESSYGLDTNYILEVLMSVPERPQEIKDDLSSLFLLIDEGKIKKAHRQLEKLRKKIGDKPELTKADVLIHRKETLGR